MLPMDSIGPDSDVDLLVAKSGVPGRGQATGEPSSARLFWEERNGWTVFLRRGAAAGGDMETSENSGVHWSCGVLSSVVH